MALEAIIRGSFNSLDYDGRAADATTAHSTMDELYRGSVCDQQAVFAGAFSTTALSSHLCAADQARLPGMHQPDHCSRPPGSSHLQLQKRQRSKSDQACNVFGPLCSPRMTQLVKLQSSGISPFSLQQEQEQHPLVQPLERLERPIARSSWPSLLRLDNCSGSRIGQLQPYAWGSSSLCSSQTGRSSVPCGSPSSQASMITMAAFSGSNSSFSSTESPASMCISHSNASTISSFAVSDASCCWNNTPHHISSRPAPGGGLGDGISWVIPEFGGREVLAEYEFGPTLGCGTFGVTRLVTHRKTAQPWACKTICKASIAASPAAQSDVQQEVAILQHLAGHHGVVQLQGVYEDERNIHLVMELCTGGDLLDYISRFGRLQEAEAADVAGVMLRTLQHCHALGVVHRDIKPENFLLGAPTPLMPPAGSAASALKMSDFGVSAFCAPGERFSEIVGTPFYMAPEVIERGYAFPADVWSVGVVIYLMVAGRLPFTGSTDRQIIKAVMDSQPDFEEGVWSSVSAECKDFLKHMLIKQPSKRATVQELLQHPWLANSSPSCSSSSSSRPSASPVSSNRAATGSCARVHGAASMPCSSRLSAVTDASCCCTYALPAGTGSF